MSMTEEQAKWVDSDKNAPYFLVVHSGSDHSAVYNRHYELLFEGASDDLLVYAVRFNTQVRLGFGLSRRDQQPSWMRPGMMARCVEYHLYDHKSSLEEISAIPRR